LTNPQEHKKTVTNDHGFLAGHLKKIIWKETWKDAKDVDKGEKSVNKSEVGAVAHYLDWRQVLVANGISTVICPQ